VGSTESESTFPAGVLPRPAAVSDDLRQVKFFIAKEG